MTVEDSSLAGFLRTHRSAAGLTQEELADRAGISARTVSDVERGLRSRIYRDTASRLADALGLEAEDRSRLESLARGRAGRQRREQALQVTLAPVAEVPKPPTSLIGRDRELEIILEALGDPAVRLLTLTGPGGVGKTRLGIEVARRAHALFPDGVFFVSLAEARESEVVPVLVAHAMGVRGPHEPVIEALAQRLADREALLVLDTFEHVIDAAPTIADLLAAAPGLTVLVTSREILRIRAERELAVPPLGFPPPGTRAGIDVIGRYPAVVLFMERAMAAAPELAIDDNAADIVVEICRRVGGLPLAVELAAARVRHLPPAALRDHLQHRLTVLTGGPRDLPRRHQTMRDTVAWSYDLLDTPERATFRALSVFAGGWTLRAAASVGGLPEEDTLARCSALVDKSLVLPAVLVGSEPRYRMLDVLREFATEQRDASSESEALLRLHAEFYLGVAVAAEASFGGQGQERSFQTLETEHDNLRAVIRWSIEGGEADVALRMGAALWRFWMSEGHHSEGRSWLRQALAIEPPGPAKARIKVLWGAAWLAFHQGDYMEMDELSHQLLSAAERDGDAVDARNALTIKGMMALAQGRHLEALPPLQDALDICRRLEPGWLLATSLLNLGMASLHAGQYGPAEALLMEARQFYDRLGDRRFTARSNQQLALLALVQGKSGEARSRVAGSLEVYRELSDRWGMAEGMEGLAACAASDGMAERAARIAGSAEALREQLATRPLPFDRVLIDRYLAKARASVGDSTWRGAWDKGRRMPLDDAIEFALVP
jgi:predicted ATPase/DNA-binding XRE family transcriptional regulator